MPYVVVFDLCGPFAHFRKFYTNSSSLSYGFPPRTALMGVVAAVLGWERDTYYEALGPEKARFAVSIKVPTRKIIQTVNYIRTRKEDLEKLKRLDAAKGTQVPLEIVLPAGTNSHLKFRVYFSCREEKVLDALAERLKKKQVHYPLYLGLTEFIAQARFISAGRPQAVHPPGIEVRLNSVLNASFLVKPVLKEDVALNREKAPFSFGPDRTLLPTASFIYEASSRPFTAILSCSAYTFSLPDGRETISFMEGDLWPSTRTGTAGAATA